ncbi:MAG TPA: hypothetical protein VHP58_02995 [Alphaproteobacteria bacterium]|nr:hypothetical protein [Alphaproteobacteria bacterium]
MPAHSFRLSLAVLSHTSLALFCALSTTALAVPVPGYVPPVVQETAPVYADDTRGVYVPAHQQLRTKTERELNGWQNTAQGNKPYYAQKAPGGTGYERELNTVADGVPDETAELDRIGNDPGLLNGGGKSSLPDNTVIAQSAPRKTLPASGGADLSKYPSLSSGGGDIGAAPMAPQSSNRSDGGEEVAVGQLSAGAGSGSTLDMQNSTVRLKEERVAVRRVLQRMMDQIGGGQWTIVWDLDEQNAGLPDMEISIYAEEPFVNVLNALLARLQTRSGQPLRVIKYDRTQRLVITDRVGGDSRIGGPAGAGGKDAKSGRDMAVTESVLKDSVVSLHYDEVPLVDALENIINQAGKGQWRLRMYAGTDQVLKPAHIEEPFGVAVERILKVFNLRYEIFPGGKLIVVTGGNRFGYQGVQ